MVGIARSWSQWERARELAVISRPMLRFAPGRLRESPTTCISLGAGANYWAKSIPWWAISSVSMAIAFCSADRATTFHLIGKAPRKVHVRSGS